MSAGELLNPVSPALISTLVDQLGGLQREVLLLIYTDRAGAFLGDELIPGGTECSHGLPYRRLFERAFSRGARGLLLAHNHPSGTPKPSDLDVVSTRGLQALARPMEMHVIDHLIVGGRMVFSMRDAGLLI